MNETQTPWYDPIKAAWNTVATYSTYEEARDAVNKLSGDGFPIEHLDIVGSDLRLVERVTGRMTKGRAAGRGALSGMGLGLFLGLLLGLFVPWPAWLGMVLVGLAAGAAWGAAFGFAAHTAGGARKDFSSVRNILASRYDVVARDGQTDRARAALGDSDLAGRL